MAFAELFPFGEQREDLRMQNTIFWLRSALIQPEPGQELPPPSTYRLRLNSENEPQTEADAILAEIRSDLL